METYDSPKDVAKKPVDQKNEYPIKRAPSGDDKLRTGLLRQRLKQEKQVTHWRESLFNKMMILVFSVEGVGVGLLVCYVVSSWHSLNTVVLSVWFGSNVVQVVGILLVITRHLFPKRRRATT